MAAVVGKYAANKFLKKHMSKYEDKKVEGGNDPYFAMVEDPRRPGKLKKVKKQIPNYIPEHDAMVLASVRKRAYHLDCGLFTLFGIRFGWESVIGLIPAAGDAIGSALALMVVRKCNKVEGGLGNALLIRMLINIAVDFLVGLVPFIGDLADAAFKANTKNLRLLEEHLDTKYKPDALRKDDRDLAGVDREKRRSNRKSGIYAPNDPPPATAFDYSDSEEDTRRHDDNVQQPRPTRAPEDRRGGDRGDPRGGFFSGSKSKRGNRDTELRSDARRNY
ncbi:hypothetical protein CB0940_02518 [Cercospora beticola]|uniref:Ph domain-containing protein n=1 Tax=Cercospora beticola TaxID=122368 RepID=A0A2G5I560_CERBT|nr:hypothetical protein CB0940_02518 [Cercospora beticola]PIA99920.1 hypothetical protein CB0940_02518 [Cercospora beticola]WPA99658.1 hypothetical protein RHO25_004276 [Cercospora beticola]CAK1362200.1 unnamed protein product [Cercospora beticola]